MYTSFYQFSEKPFHLTPDPTFLFYTPSHREALAAMIYGINQRCGCVAITGEYGTGKTTLVYTLLSQLNQKVKTVLICHTPVTFEQLLKHMLIDLNLPATDENKMGLLYKLHDYLVTTIDPDETLVLIIDEAHLLPLPVLKDLSLLFDLKTTTHNLIQIILIGQPELAAKLEEQQLLQLAQLIDIRRSIKPLSREESRAYLDHRLQAVGSSSGTVFTSDAVALICKHAAGIPRMINIICDNALLLGYRRSQQKISGKIIGEVIRNLGINVEGTPAFAENRSLPSPTKSVSTGSNIPFYLVSLLLLSALVYIALSIRGYFREIPVYENIPHLTEIIPETHPDAPPRSPQHPSDEPPQSQIHDQEVREDTINLPAHRGALAPFSKHNIFKTVYLKGGKGLYSVAIENYGMANPTIYDLMLQANPDITDIRSIPANKQIILPTITLDSFIEETGGRYTIFIGTFESIKQAEQVAATLSGRVSDTLIQAQKFSLPDTWYRLTAGRFETPDEARAAIQLLMQHGIIVIPEPHA